MGRDKHAGSRSQRRLAIYLAGPITGVGKEDAMSWREKFQASYGHEFEVRIPQSRDHENEKLVGLHRWRAIAEGERKDILNCNATIAHVDRPSMGTAMGIMYAYLSGRTVVVVSAIPEASLSPMVLSHAHLVCRSLEEAVAYIRKRHQRRTIKVVHAHDGSPEQWDESRVEKAIADAIALMSADDRSGAVPAPEAGRLADTVIMQLEDRLESGELRHELLSTRTVEEIIEKVLMDNAHRAEVLTLAKTFIRQRERRRAKLDVQRRNDDALTNLRDFLHDIKGPVGNIGRAAAAVAALPDPGQDPADALLAAKEYDDEISANQKKLLERIERQKSEAEERSRVETVRLVDLVRREASSYAHIELDVAGIAPDLHVETRPQCLRDILQNLIRNAVDHGFRGRSGRVSVRARTLRGRDIVIEFWNDGEPVTRERAAFIFESGRAGSSRAGWGHGLTQVRRTVEELGGRITCVPCSENRGGDGCVVPEETEEGPPLFRMIFEDVVRPAPDARRILVADDDELDRRSVATALTRAGFEVVQAATVDLALAVIRGGGLYGAVLDVDFKDRRDGIWLLDRLREQDPTARAVVVSGSSAHGPIGDWRVRAEQAGARRVLSKDSYQASELLACFQT